jgi:hypothetical protein
MPSVSATVEFPVPASRIYEYLRTRYQSETFRTACLASKGHVPEIHLVEEVVNRKIRYWVAARDALLRLRLSGWRWEYDLEAAGETKTRVTITYRWGVFLSLITLFSARDQASNELVETVLALDALALGGG